MESVYRILILFLLPLGCFAQYTVSGRILNQTDTKPLADGSVFINNTSIGSRTGSDGTFVLSSVKAGKYELVISFVGFETYNQTIVITNNNVVIPDILIFPKTLTLNEVKIKPVADPTWEFKYTMFKKEFLGISALAEECKILNPGVLYLDYDDNTKRLTGSSTDYLEIENMALGYKIKYMLNNFIRDMEDSLSTSTHFEGYIFFENMIGSPSQQHRWESERQETYEGSEIHFLRAAYNNQIEAEGFRVYQDAIYVNPDRPAGNLIAGEIKRFKNPKVNEKSAKDSLSFWIKKSKLPQMLSEIRLFPLNEGDIISTTGQPDVYALNCDMDGLHITYNKKHKFPKQPRVYNLSDADNTSTTVVNFLKPSALFGSNGLIINPGSVSFYGAWARKRVADMLPKDFEPQQNKTPGDTSFMIATAVSKLKDFSNNHPIEKAYLHLDKSAYEFGDTIWYKAYTVWGTHHQLSALSGILYVELISPKDSMVTRQILHLTSGVSWSNIPLPASLKQGVYRIRAYTNWMRNTGPDYFYNQKIRIGGVEMVTTNEAIATNPDIQFFPEGGELVNGLRSRVAVKVINTNGLGQNIKGTIEDAEGNIVADFTTQHLGMGVFAFTPQAGKTYKAKISTPGETSFTIDMPKSREEGFTLSVNNNSPDNIYLKVLANDKLFKKYQNSTFYIIAQAAGKIYYTAKGKLIEPVFTASIEKSRFPSGIIQFTLFNQKQEPVAERIAFIQNDDTLKLKLASVSKSYSTKQPVKINLDAADNSGNPVAGNFSVAVVNESKTIPDENNEGTIVNNLLLTSELKGNIEQPNYYFINSNEQKKADLDILMLTQGYRRYEWKKILTDTGRNISYMPQQSLDLRGALLTSNNKPVANGSIILTANEQNLIKDTTTDINGRFKFTNLNLQDTTTILLRARKQDNGSNVKIMSDQPDYPEIIKTENQNTDLSIITPQTAAMLQKAYSNYQYLKLQDSLKKVIQLKQVNIRDYRPKKRDLSNSSNLNGPGNANQIIMGDDLSNCITITDCLNGKVLGVIFKRDTPIMISKMDRLSRPKDMVIIVDGNIMDGFHLNDLNANDIYSIEVLRSTSYLSIYGSNASGGALVITMRRGGETKAPSNESPSGLVTSFFYGYHKTRAFYSPKYNTKADSKTTDVRNTIYWNPNIITDKDGRASFEYFNNDTKGTYRVIIEGIDDEGNLGSQVYSYKVQ